MTTYNYNDGIGSRGCQVRLFIIDSSGDIHDFSKKDDAVFRVIGTKNTRNGKWSHTVHEIVAQPGTSFFEIRQDFNEAIYWPQTTWRQAIERVRAVAPQASDEQVQTFIRKHFTLAAEKFDKNQQTLEEWSDPLPSRSPVTVISTYSCIGMLQGIRGKVVIRPASGSDVGYMLDNPKCTVVNLLESDHHRNLATMLTPWRQNTGRDPVFQLPEPDSDADVTLLPGDHVIWFLPDGRGEGEYDWRILEVFAS